MWLWVSRLLDSVTIGFAASFPLPGYVQTVPRAELYAMLAVVERVESWATIVSDSKINVDLYEAGPVSAMKSANGDLWRRFFTSVESRKLVVRLVWVPGHLDEKPIKHVVPDIYFALNHVADRMAGHAATSVELAMHVATPVTWHVALIKKIQRRLVRIIVSVLPKLSFDKDVSAPKLRVIKPSINDCVEATNHNVVVLHNGWRCVDCLSYVSNTSSNIRAWLSAPCNALPYDDRLAVVPIPTWYRIQIGNQSPHVTHQMCSFKGILFCDACGAFGIVRTRLLALECKRRCTPASDRARTRIRRGEVPVPGMPWPPQNIKFTQPRHSNHEPIQSIAPPVLSCLDDPDLDFELYQD